MSNLPQIDPKKINELQGALQQLQAQNNALEEQREFFLRNISELNVTLDTLRGLKEPDYKQDIMIPLPGGVYLTGRITDWERMLVNVGAGTLLPKSLDDSIKVVEERIKGSKNLVQRITEELAKVAEQTRSIQGEIQSLQSGNFGIQPDTKTYSK